MKTISLIPHLVLKECDLLVKGKRRKTFVGLDAMLSSLGLMVSGNQELQHSEFLGTPW